MEQTGIAPVGPSTTNLVNVSVDFAQKFTSVPVVVANTLQGTDYKPGITDTFAVSIVTVTTSGFTANIYRVDSPSINGWSQHLQLGYTAIAQ